MLDLPEKLFRRVDPDPEAMPAPDRGWRRARVTPSLEEVYRSVPVTGRSPFRKFLAFLGPGYRNFLRLLPRRSQTKTCRCIFSNTLLRMSG